MRLLLLLLLVLALQLVSKADQAHYVDTNAEDTPAENEISTTQQVLELTIYTSSVYLAGTTDTIYATFSGEFAVSGPHSLGNSFSEGSTVTVTVTLARSIGPLLSVQLQKKGSDSFLLGRMEVRQREVRFEMHFDRRWLSQLQPTFESSFGRGEAYEPLAQETAAELPASSTLMLTAVRGSTVYLPQGIYEDW